MPDCVTLFPPAKINLFLEVLGRRPDGYHNIETVMVKVNLRDRLEVRRASRYSLVCEPDVGVPEEKNVVTCAKRTLEEAVGRELPVSVRLSKNIPHSAGLGGGSSDAAHMLLALNKIYDLRFSRRELAMVAGRIGSDVPFFMYPGAAICRGRGEQVGDQFLVRGFSMLLVYPGFGLLTANVYGAVKGALTENVKNVDWETWRMALTSGRFPEEGLFNRLIEAAEEVDGRVKEVKRSIGSIAGTRCLLSGSGSAFLVWPERPEDERHLGTIAKQISQLGRAGWRVFQCRAVNA